MIGLLALTLLSCGRFPVANDLYLFFGSSTESFSTGLNTNADRRFTVMVRTDALTDDAAAKVASAKLFVGSQTFQGHYFPGEAGDTYYQFNAGNRCSAYLKGDNVTFGYEIYDQSGHVLQQKSVTVPHIDGC
ncbi:hypothetical protein DAETH_15280 [Deinococcus aetherius]|uniref:Lipoprotein n=1 Tax=Deinococcus aetherius TaxID=200252 RepID=A0ABM8ACN8_9DEIO|nr:hypothetical protein [Deinococcus aetherius]BDP41559.1 hypothetical protein DAETH_15280 [Deinococcus aetherius]